MCGLDRTRKTACPSCDTGVDGPAPCPFCGCRDHVKEIITANSRVHTVHQCLKCGHWFDDRGGRHAPGAAPRGGNSWGGMSMFPGAAYMLSIGAGDAVTGSCSRYDKAQMATGPNSEPNPPAHRPLPSWIVRRRLWCGEKEGTSYVPIVQLLM
ncbi:hypothetical protein [Methanoculleus chikugoensis]|uniref:hypothetical protein n=1 Tax=Methanoculleus chikugoensis TaxID=118126 RepID=UPI001FB3DF0D|nr:hypothetical protein [Methanoculleus chikugoensis]